MADVQKIIVDNKYQITLSQSEAHEFIEELGRTVDLRDSAWLIRMFIDLRTEAKWNG